MLNRTLLTIALVTASGVALAQTTTPSPSPTTPSSPSTTAPGSGASGSIGTQGSLVDETSVKAKLAAEGYTGVKDLKKNADGSWTGKAMKGSTEMAVSIDATGEVKSQ